MVFLPQELSKSGSGLTIKMELQTAIQTLYSWYRTMLIHTVFQRLQFADLPIRPFTLQRAVYSWNDISLPETKLSPSKYVSLFQLQDNLHHKRLHIFLESSLTSGQETP